MSHSWKHTILGLAAVAAFAVAPSSARAAICGDLNGDGQRSIVDVLLMANCVAGLCNPATQCGGAGLADCGNTFGDGTVVNASDLNQLVFSVAGLTTLHDLCAPIGSPIACPGGTALITGTITSSQIWPASCDVQLDDTVFVETPIGQPTTVLTIQAGTTVKGRKNVTPGNGPATLVIMGGARISAIGTANNPIVFTSDQAPGARSIADWAGLVINGRSTVNRPNCLGIAEGIPAPFGGCDVNDSSGVIRFARVEFCGLPISANNETNIFTMNGVGKGSDFSFVHANAGIDDCIEWFGGTNDTHHMIASGCADDGFDWQLGYTGTHQFGIYVANGPLLDTGVDSRGIEADNSEFGNNDLPRSDPRMCNMTLVGAPANPNSDSGILLRRGTAGRIGNLIVTGFGDGGVELRDATTGIVACNEDKTLTGNLQLDAGVFFRNGGDGSNPAADNPLAARHAKVGGSAQPARCTSAEWYAAHGNRVTPDGSNPVNPGLSFTYPGAGQKYAARPSFTGDLTKLPTPIDCTRLSDAFVPAPYIGAIDPASPTAEGWASGNWVSYDTN